MTKTDETAPLMERLRGPWHHADCRRAGELLEQQAAEIADLRQQLDDEKRQHELTRGDLERTRIVRDEALRAALEEQWLIAHDEHCTNLRNCASFGGSKPCHHPRP